MIVQVSCSGLGKHFLSCLKICLESSIKSFPFLDPLVIHHREAVGLEIGNLILKLQDFVSANHSSLGKDIIFILPSDLGMFMQERPFTVFTKDPLQKVLLTFRKMNLRHLPVLHEFNGALVGIISREDMFAYMKV